VSKKVFNMQGGKHSAAAYTELEKWAYGSCVASLTSFVLSAGSGMNLNISTGAGLISDTIARRIATDATESVTVPAASASFNRIDSVIAYIDTAVSPTTSVTDNTNDILKFVVVAGTAAASPAAPTGSAIAAAIGAGKPYMVLWDVFVPQNATNNSGMTFTDRRSLLAPNLTAAQRRSFQNDWLDLSALATLSFSAYNSTTKMAVINTTTDLTSYLPKGARVQFSQTTGGTKQGIIHDVTSTQIFVFLNSDFTLVNQTISSPVFSLHPRPTGFDSDPDKYTLRYTYAATLTQASPAASTWYNIGGITATIPRGKWEMGYEANPWTVRGSAPVCWSYSTLSTSTNSVTDTDYNAIEYTSATEVMAPVHKNPKKTKTLTADTIFYLLMKCNQAGNTQIAFYNSTGNDLMPTLIFARSAYL